MIFGLLKAHLLWRRSSDNTEVKTYNFVPQLFKKNCKPIDTILSLS